ncbi:uncharacterized protein LOC121394748 isoform X1 [Xenopus laevis]|uniref:Uncharacterized protein LOC121394748 isoform X1 n=1 Tax=Xenopus laevis TaxID=8355 RepID=A0A8J1KYQ3_XENLA|nr:uncharacterized protein LOC121394748 isoform X1 [Xenopus laevis]
MEKKRRISESPVEEPAKGKKIQLKDLRICIERLKQYPLRRKRQGSPEENPAAEEKITCKEIETNKQIDRDVDRKQYPQRRKRPRSPEQSPAGKDKKI